MDYCFFGEDGNGDVVADEDINSNGLKILVVHDDSTEVLWATEVQRKGVEADIVAWVVQKLRRRAQWHADNHKI